jgi:hypothetical protein
MRHSFTRDLRSHHLGNSRKMATGKKTGRTRRIKGQSETSSLEEAPRSQPTNFLDLPLELRLQIYEMCVSVSEYITYNRKDHCICGAKHVKHCRSSDGRVCAYNAPRGYDSYICRRLGCFYLISTYFGGNLYYGERINERITSRSSILEANSQIRAEALPAFYGTNDFVFERCEPAWVTQWIYKGVQPKHLKYIKSIAWDGPLCVGD